MDETDDSMSKFGTFTEGQIRVNFHLTHERISHHSDIRHRSLKTLSIFRTDLRIRYCNLCIFPRSEAFPSRHGRLCRISRPREQGGHSRTLPSWLRS